MEKEYKKASLFSRILYSFFKFDNSKKIYSSKESIIEYIDCCSYKQNFTLPLKYGFKSKSINELNVFFYNEISYDLKEYNILYIHGGTFIEQPVYFQMKFVEKMAESLSATLIMPDYKLVPKGNAEIFYKDIISLLDILDDKKTILFGDSAGGGAVLSLAMYLRDKNLLEKYNITNVIMLSPWLDLTLSNNEISKYTKKDYINCVEGTVYVGSLWRKDIPNTSYLVSPINGKFHDLPRLTFFIGDLDILKPDCDKIHKILEEKKVEHDYFSFINQGHDFAMFPTKERKIVLNIINKIIRGNNYEGK